MDEIEGVLDLKDPSFICIGKRKAFPDHCPVCGNAIAQYYKGAIDIMGLLKLMNMRVSWVESRPVPGWKGFRRWWFVCYHMPILRYQMLKDMADTDWIQSSVSKAYIEPFELSKA